VAKWQRNENAMKDINVISGEIVNAAITVHRNLGPGLLESVYELCLMKELMDQGIFVQRQLFLPVVYKGQELDQQFRIDILVERTILIEVKSSEGILPVHEAQVLTYLKLSEKKLALLINFNVPLLKNGIRRIVNRL
jgi:GxxExxY protein